MHKRMSLIIFVVLAVTVMSAPGKPVRFRVLADGHERGKADAADQVIRDNKALHVVWDELAAKSGFGLGVDSEFPQVDFATHVVAFVRGATRSNTEEGVSVKTVTKERTQIVVTVEEQRLDVGCARLQVFQELTPYTLVEIPGTQEVTIRHVTKTIPCNGYVPHR